jgi:hypothetical protein
LTLIALDNKPERIYNAIKTASHARNVAMETKTTIRLPADVFREARIKAINEGLSLNEVLRRLVRLWLHDKITLKDVPDSSDKIRLAREAFGMWSDRDPDEYLACSRAGLTLRDREVEDARMGV